MKRLDNDKNKSFCYNSDIAELEKYYEDRYEMIKKGNTDLVTLELVMLGRALDFIGYIRNNLGIELDNKESSVYELEEVADALSRGIVQEHLFDAKENGMDVASIASAYFGFLIIANIGGEWVDTQDGFAVTVNNRNAYIGDFMERKLLGGNDLNIVDYYDSIKTVQVS